MGEMLNKICAAGQKIGLKINVKKKKIMRYNKEIITRRIKINQYEFEQVNEFKYLA